MSLSVPMIRVGIRHISTMARTGWRRAGDGLLAAGLFAASLGLYVRTLAPSVATLFDDSLEFPLLVHRLAIAHPTGYPLYTLMGRLFALGAEANTAWRVNLLSAVAGALTVVAVYAVIRELVARRWPALVGATALAVAPVFWSQSVIAEVYTLNSLFVAGLLWLALRWARQPLVPVEPFSLLLAPPGTGTAETPHRSDKPQGKIRAAAERAQGFYRRIFPRVPPSRRLQLHPLSYVLVGVYGLGLTHHRTLLLLAPALALFVFATERRALGRAALLGPERPERRWWRRIAGRPAILLLVCLCVPLLLYLYLPARGHVGSLDGAYRNTWSGFWQWVAASSYRSFLGNNPLARELNAGFYFHLFWQQFGPVGLALALIGGLALARRANALALTGTALVACAGFAASYRVPDVEVFFLPAFLVTAVWTGVGLDHAAHLLRPRGRSLAVRRLLAVSGSLLLLAAAGQQVVIAARTYPAVDLSQQWSVHDYGVYALSRPLPKGSTIVGLLGEMSLLRTVQETMGVRPDVQTVAADLEEARSQAVEGALARGGAVYITRPLPGLIATHSLGSATGLIAVNGAPEPLTLIRVGVPAYASPDMPHPAAMEPVPGLNLLGYGVEEHRGHWQAWARLDMWWQAPQGVKEPFKISARLIDSGGQVAAVTDAEPVAGAYPATAWRPGEVVADAYEIPLPAGLPPGQYTPLIIVYDPSTAQERGRAELPPVSLAGNPARPPCRALEAAVAQVAHARFGGMELLGFSLPGAGTALRPGDALPLALLWQAHTPPGGAWELAWWLEPEGGQPLAEARLGSWRLADRWSQGQVVLLRPALQVPQGVAAGTYRLKMRVLDDGRPVPWGRWGLPLGSDLDLGAVQIGG